MQMTVRDARVDGLVDRVGCEARRNEDHRRVRARLRDRVGDRVEDRNPLDVLAALARGHAGDDLGAVALVPEAVERSLGAGQALDDELRVLVDDDRHYAAFLAFRTSFVSTYSSPSIWSAEQLLHARAVVCGRPRAVEPLLERVPLLERLDLLDLEPCGLEERAPLLLGVGADVRGVAELLGLLDLLAHVERVLDDDEVVADARHLGDGSGDVVEVVRRDPGDDEIEGVVRERQILGAADHVRLHPRGGVGADDLDPRLAQPARDMTAAGGDVERRLGALGPADDQVEILALAVLGRVAVGLGAERPVAHFANSTALRAPSSIVAST